jgi:23S rRNA (cytosine1962-C5)-methyltransferase
VEFLVNESIPCLLHEDEHLLAIDKPAGLNTHAPNPFAGEGIYDWLRHREPRWAALSLLHRLDKETSGVLVFGKTAMANRSLSAQFVRRSVQKKYWLLTDRPVEAVEQVRRSVLVRAGEKYVSRPPAAAGQEAQTLFRLVRAAPGRTLLEAEPLTGRTHQIRVHAADLGFPILGDQLYGGGTHPRLCLHAAELTLQHPATGETLCLAAPVDFSADARLGLRTALIDAALSDAWRLVHGAADGWPGWSVERVGAFLLSQSAARGPTADERAALEHWRQALSLRGAAHRSGAVVPVVGDLPPERLLVSENGVRFELRLGEGHAIGLFLDQRDNRRRLLTCHVAAGFPLRADGLGETAVLNAFAYTCGFSVCAALAGAHTTSLDLSRNYLAWGRRNFLLNALDANAHEFVHGDVFDWLRRWRKKGRRFDVVLLDPPTFSSSKTSGVFRAEQDYGALVAAALPLLRRGGVLFASTNVARLAPAAFLGAVEDAVAAAKRGIAARHYAPQPPDFPAARAQPAHLKTVWLRID